jgi:hypothetical protein
MTPEELRGQGKYQSLLEKCAEMSVLALKRDILSRAAALRALVAKLPDMVIRR